MNVWIATGAAKQILERAKKKLTRIELCTKSTGDNEELLNSNEYDWGKQEHSSVQEMQKAQVAKDSSKGD